MGFEALVPGREMPGVDGKGNRHRVSTLGEEAGEGETWQQLLFIFRVSFLRVVLCSAETTLKEALPVLQVYLFLNIH